MKMTSRTKVVAIVLGIVVILGLVYVAFFNNSSSSAAVILEGGTPGPEAQTFLDLAGKIDPISFDTSVLGDPRFSALIDIHTSVIPVPVGRKDPFSSVAGMSSSASASQAPQSSQTSQTAQTPPQIQTTQTTQPSQ